MARRPLHVLWPFRGFPRQRRVYMNERPAGVNRNFSFFLRPRDPPRSSHEQPVLARESFKKTAFSAITRRIINPSGEPGNTAIYPVFKEPGISPLLPSGHEQQPDASPRMRPRPACLIYPSGNRGVCRPLAVSRCGAVRPREVMRFIWAAMLGCQAQNRKFFPLFFSPSRRPRPARGFAGALTNW